MAHIAVNKFTTYTLSAEELEQASYFNDFQRMLMQNEIARAAEEKVALKFDPSNPLAFAQREAELQGQMEILEYILNLSTISQQLTQE